MLTQDRLREVLDYNPDTGFFMWKGPKSNAKKGDIAGWIEDGYRRLSVDGKTYAAARLAWFYMHGVWPTGLIDHKNRRPDDNWLSNLREATHFQNGANKLAAGPSGCRGVDWGRRDKKWRARIRSHNKRWSLGSFDTKEEAYAAYVAKAKEIHGEFCPFD